jgi:putative membrane protein
MSERPAPRKEPAGCAPIENSFKLFLKGMFMGAADIIPGVSGGTIALITGIYERFICAINNVFTAGLLLVKAILFRERRTDLKRAFADADILFLGILGAGIGASFLILARFMLWAIEEHPAYVFSFFFGLILASAVLIYKKIEVLRPVLVLSGAAGFAVSFTIASVGEIGVSHVLPVLFFSGFAAMCAMLLPGVSGSFVLLLIGQYEYMLAALENVDFPVLVTFALGIGCGALVMSRIIAYFLQKHEQKTISFLVGLMVGALALPLGKIGAVSAEFWGPASYIITIACGAAGVLVLIGIERMR